MSDPQAFPVAIDIPVAWGEQDLFGHVNNVVYLRYFESVRMHFPERIGVLRSHAEHGIGVILASTACDFKKPVVWPQRLHVATGASRIGNTSFVLDYRITDEQEAAVATGSSVQVMYDYRRAEKVRVPEEVRAAIMALQGATFNTP